MWSSPFWICNEAININQSCIWYFNLHYIHTLPNVDAFPLKSTQIKCSFCFCKSNSPGLIQSVVIDANTFEWGIDRGGREREWEGKKVGRGVHRWEGCGLDIKKLVRVAFMWFVCHMTNGFHCGFHTNCIWYKISLTHTGQFTCLWMAMIWNVLVYL